MNQRRYKWVSIPKSKKAEANVPKISWSGKKSKSVHDPVFSMLTRSIRLYHARHSSTK